MIDNEADYERELRNHFAGMALNGMLGSPSFQNATFTPTQAAIMCYALADEMMRASRLSPEEVAAKAREVGL